MRKPQQRGSLVLPTAWLLAKPATELLDEGPLVDADGGLEDLFHHVIVEVCIIVETWSRLLLTIARRSNTLTKHFEG